MVYVVSERPAVGLSGPMADPEVLSSEDTAKSRLALYEGRPKASGLVISVGIKLQRFFLDLRDVSNPFRDYNIGIHCMATTLMGARNVS